MSETNLANIRNQSLNTSIINLTSNTEFTTLSFKFSLGFIFICLCLLTITGNLLVLLIFRRIRTVSIRTYAV